MKAGFITLSVVLTTISASNVSFQLIEDLLEQYDKTEIVSYLSCNKQNSFELLKSFSKKFRQVNVIPLDTDSIPYQFPPNYITFILDLKCSKSKETLIKADSAKLFATPFKWIIYNEISDLNVIISDYFANIKILIDSDVTIATGINKNGDFNITKIYRLHDDGDILTENIGTWNKELKLNQIEKVAYRRRRNLHKTVLNTCNVITNNDTLNHLTDKRDRHIDSIAKVNYVLVRHLSDTVNASLNYSIEKTWGYKNNSMWNGMIGRLTRNEAEIGGTALFLTTDRIGIIDYIAMTTPTRSKFIFREPKLSYVSNVFTLPFNRNVWASTWSLLLIISFVLYAIVRWEKGRKAYIDFHNESNVHEIHASWPEIVLITFGALCQQGTSSTPYSASGRITLIFLFVSFMFLYTSYAANIVALLQSSSNSIQTLKDLLNSRLQVGVDDTVFNHYYFPNATEPVRRAIYLQKVAPPGQAPRFFSIEEGINRMRAGLFAFHVETGPGYKFVSETFQESEKCGLQEIQYLQVPDPWLAIKKNSSYKKLLKVGLRQLQENGVQGREVGLIYTKKPQCLSVQSSFISVGLVDCYPPAVVLAGGLILGVAVLILEIYASKRIKFYSEKLRNRRTRLEISFNE